MTDVAIAAGYALALAVLLVATARAWVARPKPGATWLATAVGGAAWWAAFSLGLAVAGPESDPLWTLLGRMEWFGIPFAALGVFGLGATLSGREGLLDRRLVGAALTVPLVSAVMGLSHPDVVAVVGGVSAALAGLLAAMEPYAAVYVWLAWATTVEVYLLLALGTLALLETAVERPTVQPGRLLVLGMVLPPWTVNLLYLTGVIPYGGYDPTVLGFVPTGVAGLLAVDRFDLFTAPLARAQMVEELDTPLLAVTDDGRLYDYNDRAAAVLSLDAGDVTSPLVSLLGARVPSLADRTPSGPPDDAPDADPNAIQVLDGLELTVDPPAGGDAVGSSVPDGPPATPDGDGPAGRRYLIDVTELGRARGQRLGYAVQFVDVTVQTRQRERLREQNDRIAQKNEQLERLASVVSHDLETPLSTGRRLVDLLRLDVADPNEEVRQSLEDLEAVFDSLSAFADHLPRLARESVDVESSVDCDLETVARDAWAVVETGDLALRVEATTTVRADPRRLQQAFENLFRNTVVHATGESGPASDRATVVTVGPIRDDTRSGFFVADDGPGIDPGRRENVFSFGVGDGDGTGYGLAIVRTIVEAHGWTIAATEREGGGARFEITASEAPASERSARGSG